MGDLHRSIFLKELKTVFPELRAGINSEHGLLHLEMQVFADFTQRAIALRNVKDVALCFQLAEKYFREGNEQMKNAIGVSFVEHLNLYDAQWAWELLGPSLKREYLQCAKAGMTKSLPYL